MQISNSMNTSFQTSQPINKKVKGVEAEVKNVAQSAIKNVSEQVQSPLRIHTTHEEVKTINNRYSNQSNNALKQKTSHNKVNPNKKGILSNKQENPGLRVAKENGKPQIKNSEDQAKRKESTSTDCIIGPSNEEKKAAKLANEISQKLAINSSVPTTQKKVDYEDFDFLRKMFSDEPSKPSSSVLPVPNLRNSESTKLKKPLVTESKSSVSLDICKQPVGKSDLLICKVTDQEQKKLEAIQVVSEKALSIVSKSASEKPTCVKLAFKATNDSFLTTDFVAVKPNIFQIGYDQIKQIRFSQPTVNNKMTSEEPLHVFQNKLIKDGFSINGAIIIVLMPDGKYTSFDNRRLLCSLLVAEKLKEFKMFVVVKHHDDLADPETLAFNRQVFAQNWKYYFHTGSNQKDKSGFKSYGLYNGVSPGTWGELIQMRIVIYADKIFDGMRHGLIKPAEIRSPTVSQRRY